MTLIILTCNFMCSYQLDKLYHYYQLLLVRMTRESFQHIHTDWLASSAILVLDLLQVGPVAYFNLL